MEKIEIAIKLTLKLKKNNSRNDIENIISEINSLQYTETGDKLTKEDKKELVLLIKHLLKKDYKAQFRDTGSFPLNKSYYITESTDTSEINDLIDYILSGTQK